MISFPVYLHLGPLTLHPHPVFEAIAYFIGLYISLLKRISESRESVAAHQPQAAISASDRLSVSVGALAGALIGAKLLVLLQHVNLLQQDWQSFLLLALQGKTIVGALLGGLIGVELTKKMIGLRRSTGDSFVFSVIVGMMIGRVGCFLTGLSDRTYGVATALPWGIDFGDGISRHPTQLYEIGFLFGLLILLRYLQKKGCLTQKLPLREGDLFKLFMVAYLSFRLAIDFIKPAFKPVLGLSAIQIAALCGLFYYRKSLLKFLFSVGEI